MDSFIQNPSRLLLDYLKWTSSLNARERLLLSCGQLAMALEVVTQIKALEALPIVSEVGRAEAISALHTLLRDTGIEEEAYRWYEELNEWRKPKFVAEPAVSRPQISFAFAQLAPGQQPSASASEPEEHPGEPSPVGGSDVSASERPPTDPASGGAIGSDAYIVPTPEQLGPLDKSRPRQGSS